MRRTLLAVLLVSLAALTWLFLRSPPATPDAITTSAPAIPAASTTPDAPPTLEQPEAPAADARSTPDPVLAPAPQPAPTSGPRAHVFGRLVDDEGHPLADVRVKLHPVDGAWAEGQKLPVVKYGRYEVEEIASTTNTDGRYTFDVPVPTADWVSLNVEPSDYLGLLGREFGPAGGRNQPRLVAGENDLGDLALAISGAVSGEVRSAQGGAISGARVNLRDHYPGGRVVSTATDEQGRFTLGHLPPGRWSIGAEAEGYLLTDKSGVEITKRATTPNLVFTLERAPTISGVVVDERGAALADIRIWGWPVGSGKGAGARSGQDGSFTIALPQTDPYTLEVKNPGFESWGGHGTEAFSPGTNDIRIVLHRLAKVKFVVVSAEGESPIERYAIGVAESAKNQQDPAAPDLHRAPQDHPGGVSELNADSGKHTVFVEAKGYVRLQSPVQADASGTQTLKLERGAVLTGRVTHAGQPVATPTLLLRRAFFKTDPTKPDAEEDDRIFAEGYGYDLAAFVGADRRLSGDAEGAFRIEDLPSGTWSLTVSGGKAAPRTFAELKLEAPKPLDLGEIVLDVGATLRGRLILAAGQSPMGREVWVDNWNAKQAISQADGSFVFEGLAAGKHTLTLQAAVRNSGGDERREFELAAGETKQLDIDLSGRAPCKLSLHLVRKLQPQAGLKVVAQRFENGRHTQGLALGESDASGLVEGSVEGGFDYVFEVMSPNELLLARTASVHLQPGGNYDASVSIQAGELVIVLPETLVIPDSGQLSVMLWSLGNKKQRPIWLNASTEKSPFRIGKFVWKSLRLELGPVAAGRYKLRIDASELKKQEGGGLSQEPLLRRTANDKEIEIRADETTTYTVENPK